MTANPFSSRVIPVYCFAAAFGLAALMEAPAQSNVYPPVTKPASERYDKEYFGVDHLTDPLESPTYVAPPGEATVVGDEPMVYGPVGAGAHREIMRRQQQAGEGREAMVRAEELRAEGNLEAAVSEYKKALDLTHESPATYELRRQIVDRYASASHLLARQKTEEGRYGEAISLLEAVLAPNVAPNHTFSKRLLKKLQDPAWFNPALTPEHVARVQQVEEALTKAMAYYDLGDFDRAETEYFRVLNIDRYNTGARRGLEINERAKTEYAEAAYDETRARYVRQILEQWETKVPRIGIGAEAAGAARYVEGAEDGAAKNRLKLRRIIIPSLDFADTPLEDAIEFLQQKSVELDVSESDPEKKGLNLFIDDASSAGPSPRVTLKLTNVPLGEALRYTTELASRKVKVEAFAVKIVPLSAVGDELFTKQYRVPPSFLRLGAGEAGGGGAAPDDPFAAPSADGGDGASALRPPRTAEEVISEAGITFPPGSSAFFNPASSQLVVRNTQSNMQLIDTFVDSIIETGVQKQIQISSKFVEIQQNDLEEFGFDWLLGPFTVGSDNIFGSGGTPGSTGTAATSGAAGDFPVIPASSSPGIASALGNVTSALRSGQNALNSNSINSVVANSVTGTAVSAATTPVLAPAVFGISSVLTDPQFAMVIRAVSQKKGTDILTAPSVTARSGQRALIEVIREFIYPTEYDPPELPTRTDATGGTFPVTPANPTAFETRSTGVTLEVDPVIGPDGFTIDLNVAPEVVEFDGFINYGSPITAGGIPITANRIVMPVFSTRKATTAVTVWDGQTVVIGGLIREDVQSVEDKIPILGDAPVIGRLFRSKVEQRFKRNLTMFVTAKMIDPAGQPIRKFEAVEAGAGDTVASGSGGSGGATPPLPTQ